MSMASASAGTERLGSGGTPLTVSLASSASLATLAGCGVLRTLVPDLACFFGLRVGGVLADCRDLSVSCAFHEISRSFSAH